MSASKVLDQAERQGLLDAKAISELRKQVAESKFVVTPEAIAKILVDKGHATYREEGLRYVYLPAANANDLHEEALKHLIRTFFNGSPDQTIAAVLRVSDSKLSDEEIARIQERIRKARSKGE